MAPKEYVSLIFCGFLLFSQNDGKTCKTAGPCMCEYDDGSGTVDLTSVGNTDGTPRMKDKLANDNTYKYSYNPCTPFTERDCKDVAVCEVLDSGGSRYTTPAGAQDGAQFGMDGSDLKITYKTRQPEFAYTTNVILKCDNSVTGEPKWEVQGTQPDYSIKLGMTHKCVCPNACGASGGSGGLSVGSILCIIFFVGIILYFAVGVTFMFFVKKETGKNVVPNVGFWTVLPGYIKDGGTFVISKATGKGGYSEI